MGGQSHPTVVVARLAGTSPKGAMSRLVLVVATAVVVLAAVCAATALHEQSEQQLGQQLVRSGTSVALRRLATSLALR